jgi:hypothetical protein
MKSKLTIQLVANTWGVTGLRGSSPLKSREEACVEWATHLMKSGAGTTLIVNALLTPPLLHSHHYATALRHAMGIKGAPGRFPKVSLVVDG